MPRPSAARRAQARTTFETRNIDSIPVERRFWSKEPTGNPNSPNDPPKFLFPDGIYLYWSSPDDQPPLPVNLNPNFGQASRSAYWRCPGGATTGLIRSSGQRYNLMDNERPLLVGYRWCIPETKWVCLTIDNKDEIEEEQEANEEEEEAGEEEEEELIVPMDVEFPPAPASPTPFANGIIVNSAFETPSAVELVECGAFKNLFVSGKAMILSDPKTKTNIERLNIPGLVQRFAELETITYNNIHGDRQMGLNANNLKALFPLAISSVPLPNGGVADAVDQSAVLALLVKAVQETLDKTGKLERTVAALKLINEPMIKFWLDWMEKEAKDVPENASPRGIPTVTERSVVDIPSMAKHIAEYLSESNAKCMEIHVKTLGPQVCWDLARQAMADTESTKSLGGRWFTLAMRYREHAKTQRLNQSLAFSSSLRDYQLEAVRAVGPDNAIVVMPTGTGKTLVAIKVCEAALQSKQQQTCAIFVCQDRHLCQQQLLAFALDGCDRWKTDLSRLVYCVGGDVLQSLEKGKEDGKLVFKPWTIQSSTSTANLGRTLPSSSSTAKLGKTLSSSTAKCGVQLTKETWSQVVSTVDVLFITAGFLVNNIFGWTKNDGDGLDSSCVELSRISLVIFDEVHHANEGDHNFVLLARMFSSLQSCQLLGLSASPVSGTTNAHKLRTELEMLKVNMGNAKIVVPLSLARTNGPDVKYIRADTSEKEWRVSAAVDMLWLDLRCLGWDHEPDHSPPSEDLGQSLVDWARKESSAAESKGNTEAMETFKALTETLEVAMLMQDMGATAAKELLMVILKLNTRKAGDPDRKRPPKALDKILHTFVNEVTPILADESFETAKLKKLVSILSSSSSSKTLVRVATRRGVFWLTQYLLSKGIKAAALVGRSEMAGGKTKDVLQRFMNTSDQLDRIDVLVGTSLVEEGLDLTACDRVIAYSVKGVLHSGKALIQNAGRARKQGSQLLVLCNGSKDEADLREKEDQVTTLERVIADEFGL